MKQSQESVGQKVGMSVKEQDSSDGDLTLPQDPARAAATTTDKGRVPRGRCMPPVLPSPNPQLAAKTIVDSSGEHKQPTARAVVSRTKGRHRRIVIFPNGRRESRKPMPKWKRSYVGFKRKVNSSLFVPLLLLLGAGGLATHVLGLVGAFPGYFTWKVECEGVVSVVEEDRASGIQQYRIGWAGYKGTGPGQTSDVDALTDGSSGSSDTSVDPSFGRGGVAGSSISKQDWLGGVGRTSAAFGLLTMFGHLYGFVFHLAMLTAVAQLLFRTHFRHDRSIFVTIVKASAGLCLWLTSFGAVGFNLVVQDNFAVNIASTLRSEGFLCAHRSANLYGEYAYIATGFGCAASALTLFLTSWYGKTADNALADRFKRKASLTEVAAGNVRKRHYVTKDALRCSRRVDDDREK